MLVNNTGKSVRCRYSDSLQLQKGPRAFQLRYKDSVRAQYDTRTYCRQSALIKQASDQRRVCGERLTGFRIEDVQGSYYICQLWLNFKKNMKLN